MAKERLFELIREEDVVLFVGAGFSLYADYPSGAKLAEIIYNKLTKEEREEIDFTNDLSKLTEDIYHLKRQNNNLILSCIREVFSVPPKSIITHQLLGKIPQFRTIITTNYDSLIETCNKDLEVVRKSKDIPMINRNRPVLYKIHGDLNNLDEIILKTSDYENYFIKDKEQAIFWNQIKSALARHHILFIGYSLEDSNIRTIIEKIYKELGDLKKEAFFISPSVKRVKKSFLDSKGIQYIESTGEEFINELTEDLRLNYFPHILSKGGSADTALLFGEKYDFIVDISKERNKPNLILNRIIPSDKSQSTLGNIKLSINVDEKTRPKIVDFQSGKSESLFLSRDNIKDYSEKFGQVQIRDVSLIKSVIVLRVPILFKNVCLVFENGYETKELEIKFLPKEITENEHNLVIELLGFKVELKIITNSKGLLIYSKALPVTLVSTVNNGIEFYKILGFIAEGQKFKAYSKTEILYTHPIETPTLESSDRSDKDYLAYFEDLKEIEKFFKIRFSDINFKELDFEKVAMIKAFMHKSLTPIKAQIHTVEFIGVEEKSIPNKLVIGNLEDTKKEIFIHGHSLCIGRFFLFIPDALVISKRIEKQLEGEFKIRSEKGLDYIGFSEKQKFTNDDLQYLYKKVTESIEG